MTQASAAFDHRAILEEAFARFTESSEKLEARHKLLREQIAQLTAQLNQKEAEIKRAERLSMLGETAAALAHEVRNPLGAIKLFLSLLQGDVGNNPPALKTIGLIDKSIDSLEHLVSNILHFSKERALSLAPVNLHSILHELILGISRGDTGTQILSLDLKANPMVTGDEHALRRAFSNLLINAQHSTKNRGEIRIASCDAEDGFVGITIADSGPGISLDVLPRLFEPFVTTKSNGTGLGLAIVHQIITQHGGTITARNEGGAVFEIRLPRQHTPNISSGRTQ